MDREVTSDDLRKAQKEVLDNICKKAQKHQEQYFEMVEKYPPGQYPHMYIDMIINN